MDYENWYTRAVKAVIKLEEGATFEVKDLFLGIKWNSLTAGEKKSFGRYFSSKVEDNALPEAVKAGENRSHHNKYIRQNPNKLLK